MSDRYVFQVDVTADPERMLAFLRRAKRDIRAALGRARVYTQKTPLRQFVEEVFANE